MRTIERMTETGPILEIQMQSHECDCFVCGAETEMSWGVPVVNGDIVSNDFPDWLWREMGGGQSVCRECYEKHERGELETFDRYYLYMDKSFIGGAGI